MVAGGAGWPADLVLRAVRELREAGAFGFAFVVFAAGALAGALADAAAGALAGVVGEAAAGAALGFRGGGTADMLASRKPASVSLSC